MACKIELAQYTVKHIKALNNKDSAFIKEFNENTNQVSTKLRSLLGISVNGKNLRAFKRKNASRFNADWRLHTAFRNKAKWVPISSVIQELGVNGTNARAVKYTPKDGAPTEDGLLEGYTKKNGKYTPVVTLNDGTMIYEDSSKLVSDNGMFDIDDRATVEGQSMYMTTEALDKETQTSHKSFDANGNIVSKPLLKNYEGLVSVKGDASVVGIPNYSNNGTTQVWLYDKESGKLLDAMETDTPSMESTWGAKKVELEATYKGKTLVMSVGEIFPVSDQTGTPLLFNRKSKKKKKTENVKDYTELDGNSVVDIATTLNSYSINTTNAVHESKLFGLLDLVEAKGVVPKVKVYLNKRDTKRDVKGFYNYVGTHKLPVGVYLTDSKTPITRGDMSMLETYTHETIHTITQYGLDLATSETAQIKKKLNEIRNYVYRNYTYQDLLTDPKTASNREKRLAKAQWEYMREGGLHEFLSIGLTSDVFSEKLKEVNMKDTSTSVYNKLADTFSKLVDAVMAILGGNPINHNDNAYNTMVNMAIELGKVNKDATDTINNRKQATVGKVLRGLTGKLDSVIAGRLKKLFATKNLTEVEYKELLSKPKAVQALYAIPALGRLAGAGDRGKNTLYGIMDSAGFGYGGTVQQLVRSVIDPDSYAQAIEELGLLSSKVDMEREQIESDLSGMVKKLFTDDVAKEDEAMLHSMVVSTDAQSLTGMYSKAKIRKLMSDPTYRKEELAKLESKLSGHVTKEQTNYILNQAKGLAYYMYSGKANEVQYFNAASIAESIKVGNKKEVVDLINYITSIRAMDHYTKEIDTDRFTEMVNSNKAAADKVINLMKYFDEEYSKTSFTKDMYNKVKGYSVQQNRNNIDTKYALVSEETKMRDEGYTLLHTLDSDIAGDAVGLYVNKFPSGLGYKKQAVRITDTHRRGTDIESLINNSLSSATKEEVTATLKGTADAENLSDDQLLRRVIGGAAATYKKRYDKKRDRLMKEYMKKPNGFNTDSLQKAMTPTYAADGTTQTYRATMGKGLKDDLFNPDYSVSNVVGRMFGRTYDIQATDKHNEVVINLIIKDGRDHAKSNEELGDNNARYVTVQPTKVNEGKGYWELLPYGAKKKFEKESKRRFALALKEYMPKGIKKDSPEYTRYYAKLKTKYYGVPVRKDMIRPLFGARSFSLANVGIFKMTPAIVSNSIRMTETIWQNIVGIAKDNIIIKIPMVAISNARSNGILTLQYGMSPKESFVEKKNGYEALHKYRENTRKIREIEAALHVKERVEGMTLAQMKNVLVILKDENENSLARVLIEKGGFLGLTEEISADEQTTDNNVVNMLRGFRDKFPKPIQTIMNYATLNGSTIYHKKVSRLIQEDDFTTKYAIWMKLTKDAIAKQEARKKRKLTKEEVEKIQNEVFYASNLSVINYGKLDSDAVEYLNKMGFIMFTKFAVGAQTVLKSMVKDRPFTTTAIELLQRTAGIDIEDVFDYNPLNINYANYLHGIGDILDSALYTAAEAPKDFAKVLGNTKDSSFNIEPDISEKEYVNNMFDKIVGMKNGKKVQEINGYTVKFAADGWAVDANKKTLIVPNVQQQDDNHAYGEDEPTDREYAEAVVRHELTHVYQFDSGSIKGMDEREAELAASGIEWGYYKSKGYSYENVKDLMFDDSDYSFTEKELDEAAEGL